jgi:hypothetical protein
MYFESWPSDRAYNPTGLSRTDKSGSPQERNRADPLLSRKSELLFGGWDHKFERVCVAWVLIFELPPLIYQVRHGEHANFSCRVSRSTLRIKCLLSTSLLPFPLPSFILPKHHV